MSNNNINMLKPMFPYVGGKRLEITTIKKHKPYIYKKYCEPFFGGGAAYFMLGVNTPSHINDVNESLVTFYKGIKNGESQRIINFLNKAPRTKKAFNKIKQYPKISPRKFIYLLLNTFRSVWKTDNNGKFNGYFYKNNQKNTYNGPMAALNNDNYEKQLQNATITCEDFETVMNKNNDEDTFMFLDPPYHKTLGYGNEFSTQDQIRLANAFKNNKSMCLMIINKTELTAELYKHYIVEEYIKSYTINNGNNPTIHIVVKNY